MDAQKRPVIPGRFLAATPAWQVRGDKTHMSASASALRIYVLSGVKPALSGVSLKGIVERPHPITNTLTT